jgi:hypothetical protein
MSLSDQIQKYHTYPDILDIINNHPHNILDDCCHKVLSVSINGSELVYKKISSDPVRSEIKYFLKQLEKPLLKHMIGSCNLFDYRDVSTPEETSDIESRILAEWKTRGIPCMSILERQNDALIYKYFNSNNLRKILKYHEYPNSQYTQMLDLISIIRDTAKSENNPLLLHPDMLPKNFLHIFDENKTIAIDPGLKLKDFPLEYLDAKINLIFIYDLFNYPSAKEYTRDFIKRLTRTEKKLIREVNTSVNYKTMTYFKFRKFLLEQLTGRKNEDFAKIYSKNVADTINSMLEKN